MASGQHGTVSDEECTRVKVVVTGASGFIGSHLLPLLVARGCEVVAISRSPVAFPDVVWRHSPDLGPGSDWSGVLPGADAVVHLAGRAHVLHGRADEELLCRRINTEGTRRLARQAAEAGVRHFVFLSSCHAVAADSREVLARHTVPRPVSAYGQSKLAAEQAVREELGPSACAWTILRPPLVYGRGNRANFARLAALVRSGWPVPLAGVKNRRSLVGAANLADFVVRACLENDASRGRVYYPADEPDLSTPELIELLAAALGRRARLFALPGVALRAAAQLPGLRAFRTLTASLFVDTQPHRRELGWTPPYSARQLMMAAAESDV
jgi:nucleoside-diphosphate-sugar epimerase